MKANLDNLGNFSDFKSIPQIVRPECFIEIEDPMLILKFYSIVEKGQPFIDKKVVGLIREFSKSEAVKKRIDPLSGLGFVILGKDMLNVARWDQKTPYLLKNCAYEYTVADGATIASRKLDINAEGAFCAYELGIVAHEKKAWLRYLGSKRELNDKVEYLNNRFSGEV